MSLAKKYDLISEQEYLNGELLSDIRHEYIEGEVYAMVGAHKYHNQITGEVFRIFANHLLDKPCQPYASDMKVKIDKNTFIQMSWWIVAMKRQIILLKNQVLSLRFYQNPLVSAIKQTNV